MTKEVCDCGSSSFTKSDSNYRTCDKCGTKSDIPLGTINDFKKSVPKPPKPPKPKPKPKRASRPKKVKAASVRKVTQPVSGSFLDTYRLYHWVETDSPPQYGWWMGAQLLGHAMGREHVNDIEPGNYRHNLYVTLLGISSWPRKTTSQELAMETYHPALCSRIQFTPESVIRRLAENPTLLTPLGEFSRLLKYASKSGTYMSEIVETYNELYDCPKTYSRDLMKGYFYVEKPYVSASSTVTPSMLGELTDKQTLMGGFMARWIIVDAEPTPMDRMPKRSNKLVKAELRGDLKNIISSFVRWQGLEFELQMVEGYGEKKVPKWKVKRTKNTEELEEEACAFTLTHDALELYHEYYSSLWTTEKWRDISSLSGRFPALILKLSDIILVSNSFKTPKNTMNYNTLGEYLSATEIPTTNDGAFLVGKECVEEAWKRLEPCLEYSYLLSEEVLVDRRIFALQRVLNRYAPITHSLALKRSKLTSQEMTVAIATLTQQEAMITMYKQTAGRTATYYCRAELEGTQSCSTCKLRAECKDRKTAFSNQ